MLVEDDDLAVEDRGVAPGQCDAQRGGDVGKVGGQVGRVSAEQLNGLVDPSAGSTS